MLITDHDFDLKWSYKTPHEIRLIRLEVKMVRHTTDPWGTLDQYASLGLQEVVEPLLASRPADC